MTFKKGHKINIGRPCSKETKKKISEANKGINHPLYGIHLSEETKRKLSKSLKGHPCSEELKRKLSESNKGKHQISEETRNKLIISHEGKHPSEKTLQKMSQSRKGENNPAWKGGISPLRQTIAGIFQYRQWRSDIFHRDNYTCQECGKRDGGILNAHHIKSFSSILQFYEITTFKEALNCEELWNINNGITLCKKCHKKNYSGVLLNA